MDSDMTRSLWSSGAVEKIDGLWKITEAGREVSAFLATLAREPSDDGINFDYAAWKKADKAFDHKAFDAKMEAVEDEARVDGEKNVGLDKWMAAHERIMGNTESPPFKPNAMYNKPGDGLQVYLCTDDSYTQWLCPGVEVMRAFSDKRIVGFNVWGLSHVVSKGGGELHALPDEDERFLTVKALRPPGDETPPEPVVKS